MDCDYIHLEYNKTSRPASRAGHIRKSITVEIKKTGDIPNCCGSTVVEITYPINAITAMQNLLESLLMPFQLWLI